VKRIAFVNTANRSFRKLPGAARDQIIAKLQFYAQTGGGDVKALVGQPGLRLRSGDYRVLFTETETTILVHRVGHRRDIY
jgi:mRNA interferase RelE/StbE